MPDPDETVSALRAPQAGDHVRHRGIREVHPAHDPGDEVRPRCRLEKLACLLVAGDCLHEDGAIDTVLNQLWSQVVQRKRETDRGVGVAHARVVAAPWDPEVYG